MEFQKIHFGKRWRFLRGEIMDWDEIEKHCGKYPYGTVFENAWWASRVENHLRMKKMEIEKHGIVPDNSNVIIISGENCRIEILSIGTDDQGRTHILLKSHPKDSE